MHAVDLGRDDPDVLDALAFREQCTGHLILDSSDVMVARKHISEPSQCVNLTILQCPEVLINEALIFFKSFLEHNTTATQTGDVHRIRHLQEHGDN